VRPKSLSFVLSSASKRALEDGGLGALRSIACASFRPRGAGYDASRLKERRVRALRGGANALAIAFTPKAGVVKVDVLASGETSTEDVERAIEAARGMAAVDDDPSELLAMVRDHPVLGKAARRSDPRIPRTPTLFETFATAVIEQLVTGFEARNAIRRLWWQAGEAIPGTKLRAAPTATAVRRVPMWRLREMGIGARRAATLREGAIRGPALERLRQDDPERAIEKLTSLPGVGPWTANYVARDALGWADAVPVGDFHAPGFVTRALMGEEGGDDEMVEALEPFRPHRARVVLLIEAGLTGPFRVPKVDAHRREPWRW
jgi:3-methyladenine DNA glycosylase/8-oxoguanine DNA glycosylase